MALVEIRNSGLSDKLNLYFMFNYDLISPFDLSIRRLVLHLIQIDFNILVQCVHCTVVRLTRAFAQNQVVRVFKVFGNSEKNKKRPQRRSHYGLSDNS